jgi:putative ABC transport system permease protein
MFDLKYAFRLFLKNPGFSLVAVAVLAIGIGANSAIFSIVNTVLLRPLPYPQPERLMMVWVDNPVQGYHEDVTSYPNFLDWQAQNTVFETIAAYFGATFTLTGSGDPEQLNGAFVTSDFFRTLGVEPALGRWFSAEEFVAGRNHAVVLAYDTWQQRFGGRTDILGTPVQLNGLPYAVVGIAPAGFAFPGATFWAPLAPEGRTGDLMPIRGTLWLEVIGRLKSGVTERNAQAAMDVIAARLRDAYPQDNAGQGINLEPLHESIVGDIRPALLVLLAAVGFVLVIACANVANLLLAKAATRRREMALRAALGAARARVIRQVLVESVLLAAIGAGIGLLIASWGLDLLVAAAPPGVPRLAQTRVDVPVLLFTALATIVTALAFGIVPAVQVARTSLNEVLQEAGRTGGESQRSRAFRSTLVVAEIAAAVVLLVAAGLMINSFVRLQSIESGFEPERVLSFRISLPNSRYPPGEAVQTFHDRVLERVRAIPGVESAALASTVLLSALPNSATLSIEGRPPLPSNDRNPPVPYDSVTPGFFETVGMRLRAGRHFTAEDDPAHPDVAIVNEAFVRRYFSEAGAALGTRVTYGNPQSDETRWMTIVGIVGDARRQGPDVEPAAELFMPMRQALRSSVQVLLRTAVPPASLAGAARAAVWSIDPQQPITSLRPLDALVADQTAARRFNTWLLGLLSGVALLLASIGLYGLISYSIVQRTREIGIRLALGAQPGSVLAMVLRDGMRLTAMGLAAGAAIALVATRAMTSLLFGVEPTDPLTFASIAAVLATVAALACYVPGRRAARVDPIVALRHE